MAFATSGTIGMLAVNSLFGRGYAISGYRGTNRYTSAGLGTFPVTPFPFTAFYGTSPSDEWNCACVALCACSSDCSACSK